MCANSFCWMHAQGLCIKPIQTSTSIVLFKSVRRWKPARTHEIGLHGLTFPMLFTGTYPTCPAGPLPRTAGGNLSLQTFRPTSRHRPLLWHTQRAGRRRQSCRTTSTDTDQTTQVLQTSSAAYGTYRLVVGPQAAHGKGSSRMSAPRHPASIATGDRSPAKRTNIAISWSSGRVCPLPSMPGSLPA